MNSDLSAELAAEHEEAIDAAEELADAAEAADDEQMLIESESETETESEGEEDSVLLEMPYNFVMDEDDMKHQVMVEAESESGISTMTETEAESEKAGKHRQKSKAPRYTVAKTATPPQPAETKIESNPTNAGELLVVRQAPAPGDAPLLNTFMDAPVAASKPENKHLLDRRMQQAKLQLTRLAFREQRAARAEYEKKVKEFEYARSVEKGRQSQKFQRALPPAVPILPHPSSNAATFNGDRNHNTLFPAATAKSDGKAPSQDHDFQHRGDGDAYLDHTNLVEHQSEATLEGEAEAEVNAEAEAAAQAEAKAQAQVVAQAKAALQSQLQAATAAKAASEGETEAAAEGETEAAAEGEAEVEAEAEAGTEAAAAAESDATTEAEAEATTEADTAVEAETAAEGETETPAEENPVNASDESAPVIAKEPCAEQCDPAGAWRTAECQDCIVRGMVNGWIVKSIVDKQRGYNYAHWSRNKCVAYANELQLRTGEVKGAPFAHCFFQKMHETCNL